MSQQLPEAAAELLRTPLTVEQRLELIGELWEHSRFTGRVTRSGMASRRVETTVGYC